MPSYKLMYFNGRGRAEASRYLFALAGVEYEDYRFAEGEWPRVKPTTPCGQAPVLVVDGVQIAQSHAIERFLARRFGFCGKTDIDQARVDMIVETMEDLVKPLLAIRHEKEKEKQEELIKKYVETELPNFLDTFENFHKANDGGAGYFVGDSITIADISFTTVTDFLPMMNIPFDLESRPTLKALISRVNSDPKIAAWREKRPQTQF